MLPLPITALTGLPALAAVAAAAAADARAFAAAVSAAAAATLLLCSCVVLDGCTFLTVWCAASGPFMQSVHLHVPVHASPACCTHC
jgi:hypothetical protein